MRRHGEGRGLLAALAILHRLALLVRVVALLVHALTGDRREPGAGDRLVFATLLLLAGPAHACRRVLAVLPLDPAAPVSGANDLAIAEILANAAARLANLVEVAVVVELARLRGAAHAGRAVDRDGARSGRCRCRHKEAHRGHKRKQHQAGEARGRAAGRR